MKFRAAPSFASSLRHALRGLGVTFRSERSFRWQCLAGFLAVVLAWALGISAVEWALILVVTGLVLVLELLNSSLERVVDIAKPRLDDAVRDLKDIAAGAVFVASCAAFAVGLIILLPPLVSWALSV